MSLVHAPRRRAGSGDHVSVAIRDARPEEAEALAQLQRAASVEALAHIFPPDRYPFPLDDVRERWANALGEDDARVLVADEGALVGAALARPEWLDGLYVVPASWGRGVGPSLHDEALRHVRELGSSEIHLWVLEDNWRARRFYERRGWRLNGTTRVVPFPPNPLDVGYSLLLDVVS